MSSRSRLDSLAMNLNLNVKAFTTVFGIALVGIAVCLAGTIVTAVRLHHVEMNPPPISIPTPALPR